MAEPIVDLWHECYALIPPPNGRLESYHAASEYRVTAAWPGGSVTATRPSFDEALRDVKRQLQSLGAP